MISHRVITVADDFGLSPAVNAGVARAHREGILTSASLMVGAAHAEEAVAIARATPSLRVGLHLVLVEGAATLPVAEIPALVGQDGRFPGAQTRISFGYAFRPAARRQLAAEIRAQFAAFQRTGLLLDHANAHKHMHLHPIVGRLMIEIGREFGLRAIRVPREPDLPGDPAPPMASRALRAWCGLLRRRAAGAGMRTNDALFGLRRSGHMTPEYVQHVLAHLSAGLTELYFHPATETDFVLRRFMPDYEHRRELEALLSCRIPDGVRLTNYSDG